MRAAECGFLLLSSHLGDPLRKPLSAPQLRNLALRVRELEKDTLDRDLNMQDLKRMGYAAEVAEHILMLLAQEKLLQNYLKSGEMSGCIPITRVSERYPLLLRKRLGLDSPGCLWVKGDISLLQQPAVALVGSRDLREENRRFAREAGHQAALQGYVLVSGNARGADRAAQEACLEAGGQVISVVADELYKQPQHENVLYISEDGFGEAFSTVRALSRNRIIHALSVKTFVAQSAAEKGGTWSGTVKNLRSGWSDVYAFSDGSEAMGLLEQLGANLIGIKDLESFFDLQRADQNLFDR